MKSVSGKEKKIPCATLLAAALVFTFWFSTSALDAGALLRDRVEAVTLPGDLFPQTFLGAPIEDYRAFACTENGLELIPMQVEEHDEQGEILVRQGPHAKGGDGLFHARDECIFMARDAGAPGACGNPPNCTNGVRVTLKDRENGASGTVYLYACDPSVPVSGTDRIGWDPAARTVKSHRYAFGWREAETYAYDYIAVNNGPDILDRVKVRCTVGLWKLTYTFNEEQFRHAFVGFTDGPVRVTWKAENEWRLGPVARIPSPQTLHFYPDYVVDRNRMDTHGNPAAFGLDFFLELSHDLSTDADRGYVLCASPLSDCLSLADPQVDERVKDQLKQKMAWGGVYGPEGSMITFIEVDPRLKASVEGVFVYDRAAVDKYEYVPGACPRIGFKIVDWKDVQADVYEITMRHYFMTDYSRKNLERFQRMVTNPLEVSVEPVQTEPK